jgi:hypothetical protein
MYYIKLAYDFTDASMIQYMHIDMYDMYACDFEIHVTMLHNVIIFCIDLLRDSGMRRYRSYAFPDREHRVGSAQ